MESQLLREKRKISRNLEGIRNMDKLPGALIVIDVSREHNALREARSLGIPTVCLIDTDGDPDMVDIPIPGNDDSMRSIEAVIRELCAAVTLGKQGRTASREGADEEQQSRGGQPPKRRSNRSQFRAEDAASPTTSPNSETADAPETPVAASTERSND